jgi:hypothetical protein
MPKVPAAARCAEWVSGRQFTESMSAKMRDLEVDRSALLINEGFPFTSMRSERRLPQQPRSGRDATFLRTFAFTHLEIRDESDFSQKGAQTTLAAVQRTFKK